MRGSAQNAMSKIDNGNIIRNVVGTNYVFSFMTQNNSLTDSGKAGFAVATLIEMHVSQVSRITIGADHRHEKIAACTVNGTPEFLFFFRSVPATFKFGFGPI